MNVSLYQAASALNASARWQESIAENLATSSIPGARRREVAFHAFEAGLATGQMNGPAARHHIPATHSGINFQPGILRPTGAPLDLGIEGRGFFEVQLPNGNSAYTRDGEFHLNPTGQLVTKQGFLVLGEDGPVQFDSSLGVPPTIGPGGEISQGAEARGRLRLVEFSDPQKLTVIGDGCFLATHPDLEPQPGRGTRVHQGFIEGANTSPTTEMAHLITAMRMFEANQRVMQMQDERMGRLITEVGNPA